MFHRPHGYDRWRFLLAAGLVLLALVAIASRQQPVQAKPDYRMAFRATYPNVVGTNLDSCGTCHTSAIPDLNPYGLAFAGSGHNFTSIESADSDGDGTSNLVEILALTFPGDTNSKPVASPTPTQASTTPTATPTPVGSGPTATATQVGTPTTPAVTRTPDGDDDDHEGDKTPEATRTPDGDDDDHDSDKTPEATRTPDGDDDDHDGDRTPEATRTPEPEETPHDSDTPEPTETPEPTHTPRPETHATQTPTLTPGPTETEEPSETPEVHETPGAGIALHGVIENLGPDDLTVSGYRVQIDIHTEIHQDHGVLAIGAEVDVEAEIRQPLTFYARRIDILGSPVVTVHTYLPLFIRRR